MDFLRLLPIFTLLTIALAVSHASSPPEVYWKSMLPFTPMPNSLRQTLPTGADKGSQYAPVNLRTDPAQGNKNYGRGESAATWRQSDGDHVNVFFLEDDLHLGSELDSPLLNSTNTATFWPRQTVKSIPFSKNKLPEILHKFSIKPKSKEAEIIKNAVMECEDASIKGEEKFCATSLESMVNFGISKLGKNMKVISTEAEKETMLQKYKVATEVKFVGDKEVVCHKLNYPYALYYCHKLHATVVYSVGLKGIADGTTVKAVAVCHRDTSKWNPEHLAFHELKVKPGTKSICHFLARDTVAWVSN